MKAKVKQFPDELKLKVVQEYLQTDQSQKELMQKYTIRGNNCIQDRCVNLICRHLVSNK